jgi:predicted CoA-binding protein
MTDRPEVDPAPGIDPAPETPEERAARRRAERARTIAYLDLAEARGPVQLLSDDGIAAILRATRRIAVVGASSNEARPSFGVFRYLVHQGYDCVPVNPAERSVLGVPAFRTLREAADATGPFDLVDVFRRSELCEAHAREAVEIGARCLWLQLGVVNWEAAKIAHDGGLAVVMDRCTAIEHRRFRDR